MSFQKNQTHVGNRNERFENIANELKPRLYRENVPAKQIVEVIENNEKIQGSTVYSVCR